jgi:hypothetical protein
MFCEFWFGTVGMVTGLGAAKKNTMTIPRSPSKNHSRGFFRGRSATPDRGRAPSPVTIPTVPNQNSQNMQTIPPSPRTVYLAFHSKQQSVVTTTGPVQQSHLVLVVYQDFWNLWDYLAKL